MGIQCAFDKQSSTIEQDRQGRNRDTDEVESDVLSASWTTPLCVGYSEVDKYAIQIYNKQFGGGNESEVAKLQQGQTREKDLSRNSLHELCKTTDSDTSRVCDDNKRGGHKNYGDCTKIEWGTVPDFDLLVGGFPCQAFSIAGKRLGFDDTRGTLFFEIARCLKEKRPRNFILENVKGLLSHDNGNTFKTIISTLVELGYGIEWQVLNSKNHGVPQNRERVFIVGYLGGECAGKVFPIGETNSKSCLEIGTITAINGNDILKRCYSPNGLSPILNTCGGGNTEGKFKIGTRIRRLTPTECERLQGFQDGWTEGISDSQRYKCLGNAVTTNVVAEVVSRLYQKEIYEISGWL